MNQAEYVIVGKIGSTYGVQGWVKIQSYTELTADILTYTPWYLEDKNDWKRIKLEAGKEHGKGIIVKLPGYDNPEKARLLTGKRIAVLRSELPVLEKNEYYWSDLEGLTVINQSGLVLGKVIYLIETGSNDVLIVKGDNEHAIPYLPDDVVKSIDLEKKTMHVDWEPI